MKRTLLFLSILTVICAGVGLKMSGAQQAIADEISIIPLPVPPNVIGTFIKGASRDGKRLVFDSINNYNGNNADSNNEIWVYDVDTRSIIQITDTADKLDPEDNMGVVTDINNTTPAISGDGTKIVFVSNADLGGTTNEDENYEVYVADLPLGATMATIKRITDTGKNTEDEVVKEIFNNYTPTINDDGSLIGFVSTRRVFNAIAGGPSAFTALSEGPNSDEPPDGNGEIFLYNANQRQYRQVTVTRDVDATVNFVVRGFNSNPNLSGNGQVLAFLSGFNYTSPNAGKNADFNGEIFTYQVGDAANTVRQITETTGAAAIPPASAVNLLSSNTRPLSFDGNRLVFESAGNFAGSNSVALRQVVLADLSAGAPVFKQITNQTVVDITKNDFSFLPSINGAGTVVSFASVLNLVPAGSSSVTTDNADGSREIFLYDIVNDKLRQVTFTPAWDLVQDQRSVTTSSFANDAGDLTTFSYPSVQIAPSSSIVQDLFQALIRPVTLKNQTEAKLANAASFNATQVARGSIVAAFGTELSNTTRSAPSANLPFDLDGVTVTIGGLAGRIIFISPVQINFVLPLGVANGDAINFTINNNGVQSAGKVKVVNGAPGVFTAAGNGTGPAAAQCGRLSSDGLSFELTMPPCSVGNTSQFNLLVLYGTGWRNISGLQVKIGDQTLTPSFSGAQPDFLGLDQINVGLTAALAGKADQEVTVIIPGTTPIESNKSAVSFLPLEEPVSVSNGASFEFGAVAPNSVAVADGMNLANSTANAPEGTTQLDGVTVSVAGLQASLRSISPARVAFVVPDAVQPANSVEVVVNNNGTVSRGRVNVIKASPGLFTTTNDGAGQVVAQCGKRNPDNSITFTNPPCSVGTEAEPTILRLFGTGWRKADSISVRISDVTITPTSFGPRTGVAGEDIIDLNLVPALAGRTNVDVVITATVAGVGKVSKSGVTISFSP